METVDWEGSRLAVAAITAIRSRPQPLILEDFSRNQFRMNTLEGHKHTSRTTGFGGKWWEIAGNSPPAFSEIGALWHVSATRVVRIAVLPGSRIEYPSRGNRLEPMIVAAPAGDHRGHYRNNQTKRNDAPV